MLILLPLLIFHVYTLTLPDTRWSKDTVEKFKANEKGWQYRINEIN